MTVTVPRGDRGGERRRATTRRADDVDAIGQLHSRLSFQRSRSAARAARPLHREVRRRVRHYADFATHVGFPGE